MTAKEQTVPVTVEIPKAVFDFFTDYLSFVGSTEKAEAYLATIMKRTITNSYTAEFISEGFDNMFYDGREEIIKKYGLRRFIDVAIIGLDQVKKKA